MNPRTIGCGGRAPHEERHRSLEHGHVLPQPPGPGSRRGPAYKALISAASSPVRPSRAPASISAWNPTAQRLTSHALLTGDHSDRGHPRQMLTRTLRHQTPNPGLQHTINLLRHGDHPPLNPKENGTKPETLQVALGQSRSSARAAWQLLSLKDLDRSCQQRRRNPITPSTGKSSLDGLSGRCIS